MDTAGWIKQLLDLSSSKEDRIQAAFHLENDGTDEAVTALCNALVSEPSPIVRHEVAFALGECAHPSLAAPALMRAVESDNNIFVRHEAILALATLGKKEFIPFVEKYLSDPIPEMAESAEIALQRLLS